MADEHGDTVIVDAVDNRRAETLARGITVVALVATYPATSAALREAVVPGTIGRGREIGAAIRSARRRDAPPVETAREAVGGTIIPCPAVWRSAAGLALAGPRAFGYEVEYSPVEEGPSRAPSGS